MKIGVTKVTSVTVFFVTSITIIASAANIDSVGKLSLRHVAMGIPTDADPSDDYLIDHQEYVVDYNPVHEEPNWVSWQLIAEDLGSVHRSGRFRADPDLPLELYHVGPGDYLDSGYDRGHLCPSADRTRTTEANALTFLMSNVVPQLHALNAGPWEKLEAYERQLARQGHDLYIMAGPLFDADPDYIGHGTDVPRATYKIIVSLNHGQTAKDVTSLTTVIAVIMPNAETVKGHAWKDYAASVDEIERESGYDFMSNVDAEVQAMLEAR